MKIEVQLSTTERKAILLIDDFTHKLTRKQLVKLMKESAKVETEMYERGMDD
jgi:hypothetical protein